MTILVTGGTGLLGSQLVKDLAAAGNAVRCTYRGEKPEDMPSALSSLVDWQPADILDVCALDAAMEGIEAVYHCAGMVSFQPEDRDRLMRVNVEGTANVVNLSIARGVRKLVHVSSVAALGRASSGKVINESCKWEDSPNNSAYALSKYLGEMEVWRGIGEGLRAVIVNPSILLGMGKSWDKGSSGLVKNAYEEFPWYTNGVNGFVDVRDVARAMMQLMESEVSAERFILNGDNYSYRQLFSEMAEEMHKKPPYKEAKPWMGEVIWRMERIKRIFSHRPPLLTRETARTSQLKVYYENQKIQDFLPAFHFTPLRQTIHDVCRSFLVSHPC